MLKVLIFPIGDIIFLNSSGLRRGKIVKVFYFSVGLTIEEEQFYLFAGVYL